MGDAISPGGRSAVDGGVRMNRPAPASGGRPVGSHPDLRRHVRRGGARTRGRSRRAFAAAIMWGAIVTAMLGLPDASVANWTLQSPPASSYGDLQGVSCTPSSCEAVGYALPGGSTTRYGHLTSAIAQRWDGQSWSVQSTAGVESGDGGDQLNAVACSSDTACIAVGGLHWVSNGGDSFTPLGEEWNGVSWVQTPVNDTGGLSAVACPSAQMCVAVGIDTFYAGDVTPSRPFAQRFDGRAWSPQTIAPVRGWKEPGLSGVACASASSCVAVGYFYYGRGCSLEEGTCSGAGLVERWNGHAWFVKPSPRPRGARVVELDHVSCPSVTACVVTGSFMGNRRRWRSKPFAAHWNGRSWAVRALPGPSSTTPATITGLQCTSRTACIAVGNLRGNTSRAVPFADLWNGTTWTMQRLPIPPGAHYPSVNAVSCSSSDTCIAVGGFTTGGYQVTLAEAYHPPT